MLNYEKATIGLLGLTSVIFLTQTVATPGADRDLISRDQLTDSMVLFSSLRSEPLHSDFANRNADLGRVSDVIVGADGQAVAALVNYGSFLGFGGKDIALDFDNIDMSKNGAQLDLSAHATVEDFENIPAFDAQVQGLEFVAVSTAKNPVVYSIEAMVGSQILSTYGDRIGTIQDLVLGNEGDLVAVVMENSGVTQEHTIVPVQSLEFDASHVTFLPAEPEPEPHTAGATPPDNSADLFARPELQIFIA